MIGMRVCGNQEINPRYAQSFQVTDYPVTHVSLTGIDQDCFPLNDKERRVTLSDIEKIHRQVSLIICKVSLVIEKNRKNNRIKATYGENEGHKNSSNSDKE
jgi:hypothetical protein